MLWCYYGANFLLCYCGVVMRQLQLIKVVVISLGLVIPTVSSAGDDFVEGDAIFGGEAELGATLTSGNTDTTSFKARIDTKHELGRWENQYLIEGLYTQDSGTVTAERYYALIQGDYQFNPKNYIFANGNHEIDPFTGFDYKTTVSSGYGHKFVDDGKMLFKLEVGPGYQYKKLDSEQAIATGHDSEDSWVAHGVAQFEADITDSSRFSQLLVADYGSDLEGRSETAITANIIGALAMKFAIIVRYNGAPLDDKKSTDTESNMTLLYAF